MTRLRAQKIAGIAADIPELEVDDPTGSARTLVARLGLHLRPDRRRGPARPRRRARGRPGAPAVPEPVPAQHRRGASPLRQGARARDEPRPAAEAAPRRVPRRRCRLQQGARPALPLERARGRDHGGDRGMTDGNGQAHREGLQVRPGGPLVPRLRRLRDPRGAAELHAGARHPARANRVRLGDRLRRALPVLHADLRDALDPRPGAGDRDRARNGASRPLGLGGHGRRRRALDRRQPPDPRAAAQRRLQDPALQQPDLRARPRASTRRRPSAAR